MKLKYEYKYDGVEVTESEFEKWCTECVTKLKNHPKWTGFSIATGRGRVIASRHKKKIQIIIIKNGYTERTYGK